MKKNTPNLGTHLISQKYVTFFGSFLRKSKLDELPQLINVLKNEMSLVGPRPCLFNQKVLIDERIKHKIFEFKPGITGLAQISGVDMSMPEKLVKLELMMMKNFTIINYLKILFFTALGKGSKDNIKV